MKRYTLLSDQDLIAMLKADRQDAFLVLYNRYKIQLHAHAYKKLADLDNSKDVVQELFTHLWIKRHSLSSIDNVSAYLHAMLRNRILDMIAHERIVQRYKASLQSYITEANYSTELKVNEIELSAFIDKIVSELPDKMREAYTISRNSSKNLRQIAEELGVSESTIKNHIKAALKILKKRLSHMISYLLFFFI